MSSDPKKILVPGGAGFIGSHLVEKLLEQGHELIVVDDLSLGKKAHISRFLVNNKFEFVEGSICDESLMNELCRDVSTVFHLAANSDIAASSTDNKRDFEVGTLGTFVLLNACRNRNVSEIVFSSTSAVYGEPTFRPTAEDYGPLLPVSHYGASKLAAEAMITAFCANYGMRSWIYRFANIVGPHATHGVIYDFVLRLLECPDELKIFGDGTQEKSYLHVSDCVDAMLFCWKNAKNIVNLFNLAHTGTVKVSDIAEITVSAMGLKNVHYAYTGGDRGWVGDVPRMELSFEKLKALGWTASMNSRQAVEKAASEIVKEMSVGVL
ncbi:MAG: NAD-dependent epimerase/dehydratase family protein [Lentisphaerae bacterium]|nr:NAD-dependent epimerase/dehydratase family protein [Lentisphaerota bacterium]